MRVSTASLRSVVGAVVPVVRAFSTSIVAAAINPVAFIATSAISIAAA
jgi:hypothetical protein